MRRIRITLTQAKTFCKRVFLPAVILLLMAARLMPPCWAISASDPIDTNRPSFMFSPLVLPQGSIQFENGTLYQGFEHRHWTYDIPETQVRVGVFKSTEIQMYVPNAFLWHTGNMTNGKASDIAEIGIKSHIGPQSSKFNTSWIADITVPTGSSVVSGKGVQAAFRLPYGLNIGQWGIAGMQSLLLLNEAKNLQYFPDALLSRNIGSKAAVFMEYGGFFTHNAFPVNLIHFGSVYKVTPHQQLDVQFGFGLNKAAPSAFVGAGYSFRIDVLERLTHAEAKKKKEEEEKKKDEEDKKKKEEEKKKKEEEEKKKKEEEEKKKKQEEKKKGGEKEQEKTEAGGKSPSTNGSKAPSANGTTAPSTNTQTRPPGSDKQP